MHPLWLTFRRVDLEEQFEKEQCRKRWYKESIWLYFQVLFEVCSLFRLVLLKGLFSVESVLQGVVLPLPLFLAAWNFNRGDTLKNPKRRWKILVLAKLVYMPSMCCWLSSVLRLTEEELSTLHPSQTCSGLVERVRLYSFLTITGGFLTAFLSSVGTRVPLKIQFFITLIGSALNTWNMRFVITLYALQYPGGKKYIQDLLSFVESTANIIISLLYSNTGYTLPERYPCQMYLVFMFMFIVACVPLCIQWRNEFVDREKFLQKELQDDDKFKRHILLDESLLLHSGFGIDNFIGNEWTAALVVMVLCCVLVVSWKCTTALFHFTDGVWFDEVWDEDLLQQTIID